MTEEIDTALAILKRAMQVEQEGREFYLKVAIGGDSALEPLVQLLVTAELPNSECSNILLLLTSA